MSFEKEPPHCSEIEQQVIGAMLDSEEDNITAVVSFLGEGGESIYDSQNRIWYSVIVGMWKAGEVVRPDTVIAKLEYLNKYEIAGGQSRFVALCSNATISPYIETYCNMILDAHVRRKLIQACRMAAKSLYDPNVSIDEIRGKLDAAASVPTSMRGSLPERLSDVAHREGERLGRLAAGEIGKGIKTGIDNIDTTMKPMQPGEYVILAACTSVGKTTLACNIALNAAEEGVGVLIFSLEMTKSAIANKLICIDSEVNMFEVEYRAYMSDLQREKIAKSIEKMKSMNVHIDDESGMNPSRMRAKARAVCSKANIGLIVVDYLQLLTVPKSESETVAVSTISREIKSMAKELGVPVIALSQLSRAGADGVPQLKHLRQSGSLEQDCDVAILLHRLGDASTTDVNAIIAKQRVGPTGEASMRFAKSSQRFYSVDGSGAAVAQAPKRYTRTVEPRDTRLPGEQIEYDYFEEDDTPF